MLGLVLGLYMVTGWVGAIKVAQIAKKEREEERFIGWVNATIRLLRKQGSWASSYDGLLLLVPAHTLFYKHKVIMFMANNRIIHKTVDGIELTEEFK